METNPIKLIVGGIVAVCGIVFFLLTYFTVEQYERTVVTRFGQMSYIADPGLHFKMPFVNSTYAFRTDIQSAVVADQKDGKVVGVNTYTIDNQEVDVVSTIFYRLPVDKIEFIYQNAQDYKPRLASIAVDRIKAEFGKVNAAHVAEKRGELRDTIKAVLKRDAAVLGIEITDFQLTNLEYTRSFRQAVEAAAAAKAMVETREQEKQQEVRNAEKAKIVADGVANAVKAKADGDAYALLAAAKAQAESLRIQNAALRENKDVLELRRIEVEQTKASKWDGALPTSIYSGAPIPFMTVK